MEYWVSLHTQANRHACVHWFIYSFAHSFIHLWLPIIVKMQFTFVGMAQNALYDLSPAYSSRFISPILTHLKLYWHCCLRDFWCWLKFQVIFVKSKSGILPTQMYCHWWVEKNWREVEAKDKDLINPFYLGEEVLLENHFSIFP